MCDHPYKSLTIMATRSTPGSPGLIRVSCNSCGKLLPGNAGIVRFVIGMREDMTNLRKALLALGGKVGDPSMAQPKDGKKAKRRECLHYLGWLDVAEDSSSLRGHRASNTVRCRNCGVSWPDHTRLLMIMKEEVGKLWLEVQRLGGERS